MEGGGADLPPTRSDCPPPHHPIPAPLLSSLPTGDTVVGVLCKKVKKKKRKINQKQLLTINLSRVVPEFK